MGPATNTGTPGTVPTLHVQVAINPGQQQSCTFNQTFRIGRTPDSPLCVPDSHVSRVHAEGRFEAGKWWLVDLGSSNGIYLNGQRVERVELGEVPTTVRLGVEGPALRFQAEAVAAKPAAPVSPVVAMPPALGQTQMVQQFTERYFSADAKPGEVVGAQTQAIRIAFQKVQKKQRLKYGWVIALLVVLGVGGAVYGWIEHAQASKHRAMARELFYQMKSVDVDIANVEKLVTEANHGKGVEEVKKYRQRRREMETNYNQFLSSLKIYNTKLTEQDRLVLRVSRIFGECELDMPPGFLEEVQNYIKKWQSTGRYASAVKLAREKGYTQKIASEFLAQDLPPQFFYLGMQESGFDQYISGPPTYMGIAKGMWQFIPDTGVKYGLKMGPLVDQPRADPGDDRHHWELATNAASRYIKDLYSTDAQASGLLVMASYNWGEDRVIKLLRTMPANPRERNFWKLLTQYRDKIPQETYDYVFYITAAAVIGENPRLFGFDFDNPLAQVEPK